MAQSDPWNYLIPWILQTLLLVSIHNAHLIPRHRDRAVLPPEPLLRSRDGAVLQCGCAIESSGWITGI